MIKPRDLRAFLRRPAGVLLSALALLALGGQVGAQANAPTASPIDVVLVIDDSLSMAACWPEGGTPRRTNCAPGQHAPSDPRDLRYSAARLFVQLADDEDRLAIVRFDKDTAPKGNAQLVKVGGPEGRRKLLETLTPPTDYADRRETRIDLGLRQATDTLLRQTEPARPQFVLFLTDGDPEPEKPANEESQESNVRRDVARLSAAGARVLPVVLCNDGCPDAFLRNAMSPDVRRAPTALDLVRIFGDLLALMKPNLHLVTLRNADGDLHVTTRTAHGVRQLTVVTERDGLASLTRDGSPAGAASQPLDQNLGLADVASSIVEGRWIAKTRDASAFAIVRADTYPELLHPPLSSNNPGAPRFVPASSRPTLLIGTVVGPGGGEPLLLDGNSAMKPLTTDGAQRWLEVGVPNKDTVLQVGADRAPLQLTRTFRIEVVPGLPVLAAQAPQCEPGKTCRLRVQFPPGPDIERLEAWAYVIDVSDGEKPVHYAPMRCEARSCEEGTFQPSYGHSYVVRYRVAATSKGIRFGDAEVRRFKIGPSVTVDGLPDPINLTTQPADGWVVKVNARTTEDLGRLDTQLTVKRVEDGALADLEPVFGRVVIRGDSDQQTSLRIRGTDKLRPGTYRGELRFTTEKQSEPPVELPAPITLDFVVARPKVTIPQQTIDFGAVPFDSSRGAPVDRKQAVTVSFTGPAFQLGVDIRNSTCLGLSVTQDSSQPGPSGTMLITLRLQGERPDRPQTCKGNVGFTKPSGDVDIEGATELPFLLVVQSVEWRIVGAERAGGQVGDLDFGTVGVRDERGAVTALFSYTGRPPFTVKPVAFEATGDGDERLGPDDVEVIGSYVAQPPGPDGLFRVPIEVAARRDLAHSNFWRLCCAGTLYTGVVSFAIEGVPGQSTQATKFRLTNPSFFQRHVLPDLRRYYGWPWSLVTVPATVGVPLVVWLWLRLRRSDREFRARRRPVEADLATLPPRPTSSRRSPPPRSTRSPRPGGTRGSGTRSSPRPKTTMSSQGGRSRYPGPGRTTPSRWAPPRPATAPTARKAPSGLRPNGAAAANGSRRASYGSTARNPSRPLSGARNGTRPGHSQKRKMR